MDPLQWMGAVRMRVQTADKNITASDGMLHFSNSVQMKNKNKLIYVLYGLRVSFQQMYDFGWPIPLTKTITNHCNYFNKAET